MTKMNKETPDRGGNRDNEEAEWNFGKI